MTRAGTEVPQQPSKDTRVDTPDERARLLGRSAEERKKRAPSPAVIRIAELQGKNPQELADKLDPDTLRRTRYTAREERTEDGKIRWVKPIYHDARSS